MKVVCLFSGGLDSSVMLAQLIHEGHEVSAISANYGQRHSVELDAAEKIAKFYRVAHRVVDLSGLRDVMRGSSQTDNISVPEGHYESESMAVTVVPNRNLILLSMAAAEAESIKYDAIAYAAHAGDHAIYPDCREEFVNAAEVSISLGVGRRIYLLAPFIRMRKQDIVEVGASLGVPMQLTWSCYKGGSVHCGVCGTCTERREAFALASKIDPTDYETGNIAAAV